MTSLRSQVIQLYKNLLHLGRDYPKGYDYFRTRLKAAFMKNRDVQDPQQLSVLLARGQYIIKELEALYMLKKYRTLKKRYYTDS
ncbi:electron transfer flavoprotein regulatory factor 1-like [Ornithodoros turicata]